MILTSGPPLAMEVWEKIDKKEVVEEVPKVVEEVGTAARGKGERAGRAHG